MKELFRINPSYARIKDENKKKGLIDLIKWANKELERLDDYEGNKEVRYPICGEM